MTINNNFQVNQVTKISKSITNYLATKDQQYLIDNFDNIKALDLTLNHIFWVQLLKVLSFMNWEKGLNFELTSVKEFLDLNWSQVSDMFDIKKQLEAWVKSEDMKLSTSELQNILDSAEQETTSK